MVGKGLNLMLFETQGVLFGKSWFSKGFPISSTFAGVLAVGVTTTTQNNGNWRKPQTLIRKPDENNCVSILGSFETRTLAGVSVAPQVLEGYSAT